MLRFFYFDLGNVLLKFDHNLACSQMGEVSGLSAEVVRQAVFDEGVQWQYERGEITCQQFFDVFCQRTDSRPSFDALQHAASAIFELNVSMAPIIAGLAAAGHHLGVLSNTCAAHWNHIRSHYSVLDFFDAFALSYEIGAMKPELRTYHAAARIAGVAPHEIFFTDDRQENVVAALQAGFDAVLFTNARRLMQDLRQRGVTVNY
jgi:putative hydrolase of the HAD superfamily